MQLQREMCWATWSEHVPAGAWPGGRRTPVCFVPVVWWELSYDPAVFLMAIGERCWLSPRSEMKT